MSDTPPMNNASSLNGRDKTPEISSNREKRHREHDEDDRDRQSTRRSRHREEENGENGDRDRERERDRDRDPERERERRERHRRHYENETEEERAERKRRHERPRGEETEEEREERHRRRRERDRESGRDRDRDGGRERGREYDERSRDYGHRERDRSRESHRSHRSRELLPHSPRDDRMIPRRSFPPEDRERQRNERDREMRAERQSERPRFANLDRPEEFAPRDRRPFRDDRNSPIRPMRRTPPPRDLPPPPPNDSEPPAPEDPAQQLLHEVDSEARSIFVSQLAARLTSQDLGLFFEHKLGRGAVRDARVVMDRVSRRSKGIGYVELDAVELVNRALALSGQIVMGIPISIVLTESEKNRDGVDIASIMAGGRHSQGIPRAVPQNIHFPPLSTGLALPPGLDMEKNRYASIPYHRLFVTNLASTLNKEDVTQVFEAFGTIEFVDLHYHYNGSSKETAYVQFQDLGAAQMAVDAMNGFELAGRNIKVHAFQERSQMPDQIDDPRRGPKMDATARQQLMRKLARDEPGGAAARPNRPEPQQNAEPTRWLLVSPMFDPDKETERNWDLDLAEDVKGEVDEKYGLVKRIKVDKMSAGEVYMEFETIRNADAAFKGLGGRFFSGSKLQATFITETLFKAHL